MVWSILQYVSLPYAFLFDYFGPMVIAIIGVVYFSIGSVTLALCFRGQIEGFVVRLSVFNGFLMCGCIIFDMISCVTVVIYFPTRKGTIVAIIKSLIILGQSIVGSLYTAFFDKHVDIFFNGCYCRCWVLSSCILASTCLTFNQLLIKSLK